MLAIISDLHLTDGSTCETINAGAFRQFVHTLSIQAEAASWRKKPGTEQAEFRPVECLDVILLGDILDVIRSERWFLTPIRPWDSTSVLFDDVRDITRAILRHNHEALAAFRDLGGKLAIRATHTGEVFEIPIRFHYMVGNHDWFYHLRGEQWNRLRAEVCTAMALHNDPEQPFAHLLEDSDTLMTLADLHRVHLQHGDIYDDINYQKEQGRDVASLGDAVVIETLNGFPHRVREILELPMDHPLYLTLKEADNIRPLLALPQYILAAMEHYADRKQQQKVHEMWTRAYRPFLDLPFVHALDKPWKVDTVDMLKLFFGFQHVTPLSWQSEISHFVERFMPQESYRKHAAAEPAIISGKSDIVVYGHTHNPEMIPLGVHETGNGRCEQLYINSGTWRRVHQRGLNPAKGFPFISYHVMSFVFVYRDGERFGRRHEMWQGSLG